MSLTHDQLWEGELQYSADEILEHESVPLAALDADQWVRDFDARAATGRVFYDSNSGNNSLAWKRSYTAHLRAFADWTPEERKAKPGILLLGDSILWSQFQEIVTEGFHTDQVSKPGYDFRDAGYTPLNFAVSGDYLERMIYRVKTLRTFWDSDDLTAKKRFPTDADIPYCVIHAGVNNVTSIMGEQMHPARVITDVNIPDIEKDFHLGQRGWASQPFNGSRAFTGKAFAKLISKLIDELHVHWPQMKIVVVGFPDRKINGGTEGYVTPPGQPLPNNYDWDFRGAPPGWKEFFVSRNWLWSSDPVPVLRIKMNAQKRQNRCNNQLHAMKQLRFKNNPIVKIVNVNVLSTPGSDQQFYSTANGIQKEERTHRGTAFTDSYDLKTWGGVHWSYSTYQHINRKILKKFGLI